MQRKRILADAQDGCNECNFGGSRSYAVVVVVVVGGKSKKQKNFEEVAKESEIIQKSGHGRKRDGNESRA